MNYGVLMLSKVIEQNDPNALLRFNITAEDLPTEGERKALRYITEYAEKHGGQAPTAEMVTHEVPDFEPNFGIEASYEFIAEKLKNYASLRDFSEIVNGRGDGEESEFIKRWESAQDNPEEFFSWLTEQAERFKIRTNVRSSVGTDIKKDTDKFKAEYENRKAGESFRIWRSKFEFINRAMGGYVSSNVYVIYGKSGRGKSAIALEEAISCAMQGANVLIWSMEMGWYEVLVRLYVSISGEFGIDNNPLEDVDMELGIDYAGPGGFNSRDVRQGKLSDEFEAGFMEFLDKMNELIPGNIIVRAVDDEDFDSRKLRDLKADILETKADVVLIDPFYYLDYEKNTSKTAGGDAAETSKKLRRLSGQTKTTVFALTQAEEGEGKDADSELKLPQRKDVKKTKALLEDAALLIAVDTNAEEGRGLIGLNKGRDGGEGKSAEIVYLPQFGVIKQLGGSEGSADQFDF